MPNLASALKDEVTRLARKELRGETGALKKASARHRSEIAGLKRRVSLLEQQVGRLARLAAKGEASGNAATKSAAEGPSLRFSAAGLKKLREKRGLSAAALGTLLGVTAQTVYNWESGTTRPGREQLAALAAARVLGKREIARRLEAA